MDNDSIDGLLKFEPPWREELARWRRQKTEGSTSATPSKYASFHAPFVWKQVPIIKLWWGLSYFYISSSYSFVVLTVSVWVEKEK